MIRINKVKINVFHKFFCIFVMWDDCMCVCGGGGVVGAGLLLFCKEREKKPHYNKRPNLEFVTNRINQRDSPLLHAEHQLYFTSVLWWTSAFIRSVNYSSNCTAELIQCYFYSAFNKQLYRNMDMDNDRSKASGDLHIWLVITVQFHTILNLLCLCHHHY